MIDPIVEVDRLKHTLRMAGLSMDEINEIGNLAMQDIDNTVFDIVEQYLNQTRDIVMSLGGAELADEIRSMKRGPQFIITTESGVTDFSTPPFPMLPALLKNPDISSKGEMFKVIPLTKQHKPKMTSIFDVYRDRNAEQRQAMLDRKAKWDDVRTADAISRKSLHFSGLAQAKRYLAKRQMANKEDHNMNSKEPAVFKTAHSKQDPNLDWVLPAQDLNITNILNDVNSKLEDDVDRAIVSIVNEYGGLI
jgi:hypothetical protein